MHGTSNAHWQIHNQRMRKRKSVSDSLQSQMEETAALTLQTQQCYFSTGIYCCVFIIIWMRLTAPAEQATHCAAFDQTNVYYFINQSIQSDTWTEWWLNRHASCFVCIFHLPCPWYIGQCRVVYIIVNFFKDSGCVRENHNKCILSGTHRQNEIRVKMMSAGFPLLFSNSFIFQRRRLIKEHTEHKHLAQYLLVFWTQIMHVQSRENHKQSEIIRWIGK